MGSTANLRWPAKGLGLANITTCQGGAQPTSAEPATTAPSPTNERRFISSPVAGEEGGPRDHGILGRPAAAATPPVWESTPPTVTAGFVAQAGGFALRG